jgi:pyridoxamine 5'-phosphate oxidase
VSPRRPDLPALRREALAPDPFVQFGRWWKRAVAEVPLCDAMALATVDADRLPDARMVLLKGHGDDGFRFFTNFESAKGRQLEVAPRAALVLYWRELDRQVRARGQVEKLSEADSDAYFATRPPDSRLGAWASPQSAEIGSRAELESRLAEAEAAFGDRPVPRPPTWGGYRLVPDAVEFWQGRVGRLHDRFRYVRDGGGWRLERLAP